MITIYAIKNFLTGKAYIGCTAGKLGKRMREHRSLLNRQLHQCTLFQAEWNLYKEHFQIIPLEELLEGSSTLEKRERELFWLREFKEAGKLLNEYEISFQPPPGFHKKAAVTRALNGNKHITEESNLKRRLAQLGKPKNHGWKISVTKQAKNR